MKVEYDGKLRLTGIIGIIFVYVFYMQRFLCYQSHLELKRFIFKGRLDATRWEVVFISLAFHNRRAETKKDMSLDCELAASTHHCL